MIAAIAVTNAQRSAREELARTIGERGSTKKHRRGVRGDRNLAGRALETRDGVTQTFFQTAQNFEAGGRFLRKNLNRYRRRR
jgi:hypothetical protein